MSTFPPSAGGGSSGLAIKEVRVTDDTVFELESFFIDDDATVQQTGLTLLLDEPAETTLLKINWLVTFAHPQLGSADFPHITLKRGKAAKATVQFLKGWTGDVVQPAAVLWIYDGIASGFAPGVVPPVESTPFTARCDAPYVEVATFHTGLGEAKMAPVPLGGVDRPVLLVLDDSTTFGSASATYLSGDAQATPVIQAPVLPTTESLIVINRMTSAHPQMGAFPWFRPLVLLTDSAQCRYSYVLDSAEPVPCGLWLNEGAGAAVAVDDIASPYTRSWDSYVYADGLVLNPGGASARLAGNVVVNFPTLSSKGQLNWDATSPTLNAVLKRGVGRSGGSYVREDGFVAFTDAACTLRYTFIAADGFVLGTCDADYLPAGDGGDGSPTAFTADSDMASNSDATTGAFFVGGRVRVEVKLIAGTPTFVEGAVNFFGGESPANFDAVAVAAPSAPGG